MRAHSETTIVRAAKVLEFPRPVQPTSRLLVPREHGSWGIFLLPLLSGAIVGYWSSPFAAIAPASWFCLAAISAFLVYQPLESLLGLSLVKARSLRQQKIAILWSIGLTVVAAVGVLELVHLQRALILSLVVVTLGCFGARLPLGRSRSFRVLKQLIGALGLSSTAAGAYYAITGRVDPTALLLWAASWLFAVGQIEYVQLRLRTAQQKSRRQKAKDGFSVSLFYLLVLCTAIAAGISKVAPLFLALAFIPAIIRLAAWLAGSWRPLGVHILGFSELLQGVLFNVLLTSAFLVRG